MTDGAPVYPSEEWHRREMQRMADLLHRWKRAYYYGTPEVDDATFDLHFRNLEYLERKFPHLTPENTPTQMVGAYLPEGATE